MARITLDPLTRIEGHLRLNAVVKNGTVVETGSTARMWPGFALLLKGRDPLEAWAYAQRFCGVCTTVHAVTSIRAVEQALGLPIPLSAQRYRNCLMAQHALHEHILHFYSRVLLDWVDISSACSADAASASRLGREASDWQGHSLPDLQIAQDRLRQLSANGSNGLHSADTGAHPAMRLSPELNLLLAARHLSAFEYLRKALQALELLQGKTPHSSTPQHLMVGGVAPAALVPEQLHALRNVIVEIRCFVQQAFLPDTLALAKGYPEWFRCGAGVTNYLAVPEFPQDGLNSRFSLDGGTILAGDFNSFRRIEDHNNAQLLRNLGGPSQQPGSDDLKMGAKQEPLPGQSPPSFDGSAMQTGPLAQVLAAHYSGNSRVKPLVDGICAGLGIDVTDFHSTMGRNLARAVRAHVLADLALENLDMLMGSASDREVSCLPGVEIPAGELHGSGFHEASRGTLIHTIVIRDRKIALYDVIAPSSWNAAPRELTGTWGPYEAALLNHPLANPEKPLELLRTMRSFDPCIACAVHVNDQDGFEIARRDVL